MAMFDTKYPNNSRVVSDTPQLFNDDVVLLCDTSTAPVVINLLDIAQGFWSTQWKLYVIDQGNASTNSITINAGAGQTVNGVASVTINVDNGAAKISVTSDTSFLVAFSIPQSGGGHIIADEGVNLPNQPILNFVGAGVTATDVAGQTVITIPGGGTIISLTNAQMLALIAVNDVVPCQCYLIVDALYTNGGVIVEGTTTSSISRECKSIHLNADYQAAGIYTNVAGFNSALGQWKPSLTPVIGDCVVYNNENWVSLTGVNTPPSPPTLPADWELLPRTQGDDFTSLQGYILEVDFSIYNVQTNKIVRRADKRMNVVDYADDKGNISLVNFAWGNNNVQHNRCHGEVLSIPLSLSNFVGKFTSNIIFNAAINLSNFENDAFSFVNNECMSGASIILVGVDVAGGIGNNAISGTLEVSTDNLNIAIFGNIIDKASNLIITTQLSVANELAVRNNVIQSNYGVTIKGIDTSLGPVNVLRNKFTGGGAFTIDSITSTAEISDCFIDSTISFSLATLTNNSTQGFKESKLIDNVISTFPYVLDFSNPSVYNAGVLTLPNTFPYRVNQYVGVYYCINSLAVGVCTKIVNVLDKFPITFLPGDTPGSNTTVFRNIAIGVAVANDIIGDAQTSGTITLNYRSNGSDFIVVEKVSSQNAITTNLVSITERHNWI